MMTAEQFAYWMQGFAELNAAPPTEDQWHMIREHLATVFHRVTPKFQPRQRAGGGFEWVDGSVSAPAQPGTRLLC